MVADAGLLPFRDKTISAINASAIFHEISTYGVLRDGNILYGIEAIKKSLEEILRVLAPEGILMYRDVSCPEKRLEYKTVNYRKKAWTLFIERIVPRILESVEISAPEIITGFNMKKNGNITIMRGTAQFHREIQRHYITFRDYFRKTIAKEWGCFVVEEDWKDIENGIKKLNLNISKIL